ncbi:carbohydrate kinase family protein [Orrella marina]|uniref:Carbohydrate kinase family protein n=1 Tax=Orrella marina TaxID=2163011 RepID=A0A2R4XQ44_9BURK|nr:carbohydrate kinase family protein [Orrella marina]AWB35895.1 carbohydrate kinase family protein [Orrella marina]
MSKAVLICGSVAFDTIAVFDGRFKEHILADRIHALSVSFLVPSMRKEYGGCAGNIAYNLKRLGGNPLPVATIGEDAGDYLARLYALGVETRRMLVVPDMLTAQCFITTDLDDNQISAFHPGAMEHSAKNDVSDEDAAWAIVAPDSKVGMLTHVDRLSKAGVPTIFDLGQAMPLFDGDELLDVIGKVQALALNDYEASVVEQRTGKSIEQIAVDLEAVVVTRGAQGATLYSDGKVTEIAPVLAEQVVDPTGCGDAHRAGLLYGLTQGWNWERACMLGNVMGSIKIASRGPQNHEVEPEVVDQRMRAVYGIGLK